MAHRLAIMAGELDVEKALRRIGTAKKFQRWCHYYQLEPFGSRRDNLNAAVVAKMVADVHGVKKTDGNAFSYEDLLLQFDGEEIKHEIPKQTSQDQIAMAKMIAMIYNAQGETKSIEELRKEMA